MLICNLLLSWCFHIHMLLFITLKLHKGTLSLRHYKVHLPARSCLFLKSQRSLRARHMQAHAHAQVMTKQLPANENTVSSTRQN